MDTGIDYEFMKRLGSLMNERGLDVAKLAKLADVTYVTAQRWSKGIVPRPQKLRALAEALKVSVRDLTGRPNGREDDLSTEPLSIDSKLRKIKELQYIYDQGMAAKAEIERLKLELMEDIKNIP